ncbi:MAG: IS4 family transposase [Pseudomonadota bacterium]|nr:IS4 family transposase [Pseudomonadota bacterium]
MSDGADQPFAAQLRHGRRTPRGNAVGRATARDPPPDHSLTLFDGGYYSLGLLHQWHQQGQNRHWLIPARQGLRYEVVQRLSDRDQRVRLTTSAQARQRFSDLPATLEARLITYQVKGKPRQVLTSLLDTRRYPCDDLVELYSHRWEIELGYREMKQSLLQSSYTLRSKKPCMTRQELWGLLLAYNLIRVAMIKAAAPLEGVWPNQLSFAGCARAVIHFFCTQQTTHPGAYPKQYAWFISTLAQFKLPDRRPDRSYPRCIRPKHSKYPARKKKCQSA